MKRKIALALYLLAAALPVLMAAASQGTRKTSGSADSPEWFTRHMAFLVQGSGRWIADNSAYRSDGEPFDAYGTEWKWGLGKKSVTGRLFALRDGRELGDIWQFRLIWDPGRGEGRAMQFGSDGSFGDGPIASTGPGTTRSEQTFWNPDGGSSVVGHDMSESPGEHLTKSFDVAPDGSRTPRRTYVWRLVPGGA